ncbi:MAG: hypothetical protein ABJA60_09850, partial [Nitrosospira sp.]
IVGSGKLMRSAVIDTFRMTNAYQFYRRKDEIFGTGGAIGQQRQHALATLAKWMLQTSISSNR